MKRVLGLLTALILAIAGLTTLASPASAITRAQKRYCNHHSVMKSSKNSNEDTVPGRWGITKGKTTNIYTYSFCRIPGVQPTWVRGRNQGVCFKIGFGGTKVVDSVKVDMLAWNNHTVMNEVNDFVLHLPENMEGGESRCDAKWFKNASWYRRDTLPRHRENYWYGIEPPWPDQHHESRITFLDPTRDKTISVP